MAKKQKMVSFRVAMNRLKKVQSSLELAIANPALFDSSPGKILEVANSNLDYLRRSEKLYDKRLSEIGSLINQYQQTISKISKETNQ